MQNHVGAGAVAPYRAEGAATLGRTVVIAEDEAIVRLDLREILEEQGFDVVGETGRGDEAVALAKEHHPDLVILDIKMPGLDGLSAARDINADRKSAVLILTAFSQRNLIEEARDAGALAYLVKPFQQEELLPAIEVALGRFAEMQALEAENAALADDKRSLEEQLETRRWVDRAKGKLMDDKQLSESEAFSFIQQTAMNRRTTMREVAKAVVDGSIAPEG
ncbi:MAG: response regulator [Acidimicrobiales bacterium]